MIEMSSGLMNTFKRRDKQVIIAEITKIARNGALKTQIMYKANLSFSQLNEYLALLKKVNFLEKSINNGKEVYLATPKGLEFLQRQQEIGQLLSADVNVKIGVKIPPQLLL
jgi:predicted transcriptional regulator